MKDVVTFHKGEKLHKPDGRAHTDDLRATVAHGGIANRKVRRAGAKMVKQHPELIPEKGSPAWERAMELYKGPKP